MAPQPSGDRANQLVTLALNWPDLPVPIMSTIDPGDANFRKLLKEALAEALREQRDFLRDLLAEVVDDAALIAAIREGREDDFASRGDVFSALDEGG